MGRHANEDTAPPVVFPLASLIYTAWTGQRYWGGCDLREEIERVVDAVHPLIAAGTDARARITAAGARHFARSWSPDSETIVCNACRTAWPCEDAVLLGLIPATPEESAPCPPPA